MTTQPVPKPFELQTSGHLKLKPAVHAQPTLLELEQFCEEARRLGLPDKVKLQTHRQGLIGPIECWAFAVPVQPKVVDHES